MTPVERKSLFTVTTSNIIEVPNVPSPKCVPAITAMALNALTRTPIRVTGYDIQRIAIENRLKNAYFNDIFRIVHTQFGINDVVMKDVVNRQFTEGETFQLYRKLIDNGGLVFLAVDGPRWYREIKYTGHIEELNHAILVNGYQIHKSRFSEREISQILFVKDPNIQDQIRVPYESVCRTMIDEIKHEIIFFHNKGNDTIGKIYIPLNQLQD